MKFAATAALALVVAVKADTLRGEGNAPEHFQLFPSSCRSELSRSCSSCIQDGELNVACLDECVEWPGSHISEGCKVRVHQEYRCINAIESTCAKNCEKTNLECHQEVFSCVRNNPHVVSMCSISNFVVVGESLQRHLASSTDDQYPISPECRSMIEEYCPQCNKLGQGDFACFDPCVHVNSTANTTEAMTISDECVAEYVVFEQCWTAKFENCGEKCNARDKKCLKKWRSCIKNSPAVQEACYNSGSRLLSAPQGFYLK